MWQTCNNKKARGLGCSLQQSFNFSVGLKYFQNTKMEEKCVLNTDLNLSGLLGRPGPSDDQDGNQVLQIFGFLS